MSDGGSIPLASTNHYIGIIPGSPTTPARSGAFYGTFLFRSAVIPHISITPPCKTPWKDASQQAPFHGIGANAIGRIAMSILSELRREPQCHARHPTDPSGYGEGVDAGPHCMADRDAPLHNLASACKVRPGGVSETTAIAVPEVVGLAGGLCDGM